MLCVPKTTSTHGARRTISPRSFCARQPPTAICMPGRRFLTGARWPRLPYSLLSAFSRTAQVLKTTTSACRRPPPARDVAGVLEQAGEPLGVVHVHLAPVGAHLVGPRGAVHGESRVRRARCPPRPVGAGILVRSAQGHHTGADHGAGPPRSLLVPRTVLTSPPLRRRIRRGSVPVAASAALALLAGSTPAGAVPATAAGATARQAPQPAPRFTPGRPASATRPTRRTATAGTTSGTTTSGCATARTWTGWPAGRRSRPSPPRT